MIRIFNNVVDGYETVALIYELDRLHADGRMRRDDALRQEADLTSLPAGPAVMRRIDSAVLAAWPDARPEWAMAQRMFPGDRHNLHADNRTLDDQPNHTAERAYSAVLFLNKWGADFTGGELVFPAFGLTVQPLPGLLVLSPSDLEYRHTVYPVESGARVNIVYWFKRDKGV